MPFDSYNGVHLTHPPPFSMCTPIPFRLIAIVFSFPPHCFYCLATCGWTVGGGGIGQVGTIGVRGSSSAVGRQAGY